MFRKRHHFSVHIKGEKKNNIQFSLSVFIEEDNGIHKQHAERIGIPLHVCPGDKLALLDEWRKELDLEWTQIAYMGKQGFLGWGSYFWVERGQCHGKLLRVGKVNLGF